MAKRGVGLSNNMWVKNHPAIPNNALAYKHNAKLISGIVIPANTLVNPVINVYGYPVGIDKSNAPYPPDEAMALLSNVITKIEWHTINYRDVEREYFYQYSNITDRTNPQKLILNSHIYVELPISVEPDSEMFSECQFIAVDKCDFVIKMPSSVIGFIVNEELL